MLTVDSAKRGKAAMDLLVFDYSYSLFIWNRVHFLLKLQNTAHNSIIFLRVNSSIIPYFSCFRYFERLPGDVSCMPCINDVDRAECVGKIIPQSSTTPSHSNGMKKTKTVICNIKLSTILNSSFLLILKVFSVFRESTDCGHSLYTYPSIGYSNSTIIDQMYSKIL